MNRIKISDYSFMITVSGFVFGSAPLLISSSIAAIAGRDAWISSLLATAAGLFVVWINTYLGGLYPDKTLVEVIILLLGKWLGIAASLFFAFVAIVTASQVIWYVGDFITTTYMPEASSFPINALFVTAVIIALLYGIEAMCRACEIFFMFLFPLYLFSMAMLAPNIEVKNLMPVMENGIIPILKGMIPLMGFTILPVIFLNMVFPVNLIDIKKGKKAMFNGYLLGMLTAFVGTFMSILVLGASITANLRFPLFTLTKEINVGVIFTRLEAMILVVWLTTNFISAFFYFYAGAFGLAQILKLKDYKRIVIPLGFVIVVLSDFIYKNVPYEINWDSYVWPSVVFAFGFILPIFLICIYTIKKWLGVNPPSHKSS
ncbi:MAG: GerAB/ArcD/ProY family transporter [Pseudomonadota bacterium]